MDVTPTLAMFEQVYESDDLVPWVIDEPQQAVVELERAGLIVGNVLDAGCGTGEHTIYLARLGYDVLGIDFSAKAVERAAANATARGVAARFEVADATRLPAAPSYDSVLDTGLFHIFDDADRARYVHSLHGVCRPGAVLHLLALSDTGPALGPQVSDSVIRDAFVEGWTLEELRPSTYRGVVSERVSAQVDRPVGETIDAAAWLARIRRT